MPWDLAVPSRGVGGRKGMPAGPSSSLSVARELGSIE